MKRSQFEAFGEIQLLKKLFVFKGFSEDYAHYLPKKLERGSNDGWKPSKVAVPLKSEKLMPILRYQALELQLTA